MSGKKHKEPCKDEPVKVRSKVWDFSLIIGAILIAWGFSAWIRLDWVKLAQKKPATQWEGHYLPTTHDSYLYASVISQASKTNPPEEKIKSLPEVADSGAITLFGMLLVKHLGVNVHDVITYMPIFTAGLLAIPMVLLGRLYGSTFLGFAAAILAVSGTSYFNRTCAGYYDTDMFSVTIPALILFWLLKAHKEQSIPALSAGALGIFFFPFFYNSGSPIGAAVGASFIGLRFLLWFINRNKTEPEEVQFTLIATTLLCLSIALCPWTVGITWVITPIKPWGGFLILVAMISGAVFLTKNRNFDSSRIVKFAACISAIILVLMPGPIKSIALRAVVYMPGVSAKNTAGKLSGAADKPTLAYKNVMETIVEARTSDWAELMQRISGSSWACALAVCGYILLLCLYPEFIVSVPFVGIGVFAHWGGHRFTVHAVPIAAFAVAFLPIGLFELWQRIKLWNQSSGSKTAKSNKGINADAKNLRYELMSVWPAYIAVGLLTLILLRGNMLHAEGRSNALTTVLSSEEVVLIDDLHKASAPGDYVHTWWDWGSAIWHHAERNVLTTPINQSYDTFVFAKMMTTDSPRLTAHLGRTAAEYFHHGTEDLPTGLAVDYLFSDRSIHPDNVLSKLEEHLPVEPTRDAFLYLPAKLLNFYPVLHMFSERDLLKGTVDPYPSLVFFTGYQRQQNFVYVFGPESSSVPTYLVDLHQLAICVFGKRIAGKQAQLMSARGENIQINASAISLQSKSGQLLHAKSLQMEQDQFRATLFDGKTVTNKMSAVEWIYPTHLLKKAEQLDAGTKYEVEGDAKPGLHFVFSQNPPLALLADEKTYRSQMMQLLVLNRPDTNYFELISSNPGGKVYKIKK